MLSRLKNKKVKVPVYLLRSRGRVILDGDLCALLGFENVAALRKVLREGGDQEFNAAFCKLNGFDKLFLKSDYGEIKWIYGSSNTYAFILEPEHTDLYQRMMDAALDKAAEC